MSSSRGSASFGLPWRHGTRTSRALPPESFSSPWAVQTTNSSLLRKQAGSTDDQNQTTTACRNFARHNIRAGRASQLEIQNVDVCISYIDFSPTAHASELGGGANCKIYESLGYFGRNFLLYQKPCG